MLTAVTILVLAWTISSVAETLGTGDYVATIAEPYLTAELLPVLILFIAAFVAFTMGSSWATMGLVTPIAIQVAYEFGTGFELVPVAVGAVFSGAIFGDHASPISDTTVLSATFSGADLIDHVRTQLPYALTVFLVVIGCYLLNGYLGVPPLVFLPLGVVALVGLVVGLSRSMPAARGSSRPRRPRPPRSPVPNPNSTRSRRRPASRPRSRQCFGARSCPFAYGRNARSHDDPRR